MAATALACAWISLPRLAFPPVAAGLALAWDALHRGRRLSTASLDYDLVAELLAHGPDPQAMFR